MVPFKETSQHTLTCKCTSLLHADDTMHTVFFQTTAGHALIYCTTQVVIYRWCILQVMYFTGGDCIIQVVNYTGGGSAGSIQRQAASGSWEKQWMQGGK